MYWTHITSRTARFSTVVMRPSNFVVPTVTNTLLYDITLHLYYFFMQQKTKDCNYCFLLLSFIYLYKWIVRAKLRPMKADWSKRSDISSVCLHFLNRRTIVFIWISIDILKINEIGEHLNVIIVLFFTTRILVMPADTGKDLKSIERRLRSKFNVT